MYRMFTQTCVLQNNISLHTFDENVRQYCRTFFYGLKFGGRTPPGFCGGAPIGGLMIPGGRCMGGRIIGGRGYMAGPGGGTMGGIPGWR